MTILYRGPSRLDPDATVMIVATEDSDNRKTGPMTQLWILRTDRHPLMAVRDGSDRAICGDCFHRGSETRGRTCYVTTQHAPAAIFRSYRAGTYVDLSAAAIPRVSYALRNQLVRVGAYGDPAVVESDWWAAVLRRTRGWTAYTHHWRTADDGMRRIAMASVDTVAERDDAQARGYRTYRVRTEDSPLADTETICPASDEAGHRSTCTRCLLCNGAERGDARKHIAILPHRATVQFYRSQQLELFQGGSSDDKA